MDRDEYEALDPETRGALDRVSTVVHRAVLALMMRESEGSAPRITLLDYSMVLAARPGARAPIIAAFVCDQPDPHEACTLPAWHDRFTAWCAQAGRR